MLTDGWPRCGSHTRSGSTSPRCFCVFFLLVVVLGLFSIWRLSNFNRLSADVAELWLPNTRVLGDLNNFTSDFRAIEGSNLLSSDSSEIAATEKQMADLDRSIAEAERGFERIRHDAAEAELYRRFKEHWTDYRKIVNQMLVLSRTNRKAEAQAIYSSTSRAAYDAASDALGQLTDQAVANAQVASDRLGVAYRQAFWLIVLGIVIAGIMVVAALVHISRSISDPLLHLADRMRQLAANNTDTEIPETERRDEIGEMAQATVVFRNNAIELMRSQRMLARQAAMLEEQLAQEQRLALLQRNFVSMASHEFRTPLTIIDGHARRLDQDERFDGAGRNRRARRQGARAVLRLTHLIDNLLNSARLIDGGAELYFHPAEMDMASLLREVCQLHREMVPGAHIAERFAATRDADGRRCEAVISGFQQSVIQCRQIFAGRRYRSKSRRPSTATKWSSPSPIGASAFRPAISIGCSSAIIAAATFPESWAPALGSIWSRSRLTDMAAASRCTARKVAGRVFAYACRSSAPLWRSNVRW